MSELENAIKRLKENADHKELPYIIADIIKKNCSKDVINLILQNLEAIDNAKPSEALKCLERIVASFNETTTGMYGLGEVVVANDLIYSFKRELDTIKQALTTKSKKELVSDIITNKLINYRKFHSDFIMSNISYDKYVEYWTNYGCEQLTEQEFNLLKEMSKNE